MTIVPEQHNPALDPGETIPGGIARPPADLLQRLEADIAIAGGEQPPDPAMEGAIGATMFDQPGSEDNSVTVLLPKDRTQLAPSQSLVRIKSRRGGDGRSYLGVVTAGPFAEPDSLRADSHLLVTVTTQGGVYLPPYHGRLKVTILGEELPDGTLTPPRLRPLPNSPVLRLTEEESARVLKADGDLRLGLLVGQESVPVSVPSTAKSVLPRHTAILGTTGGGKSTTVAGLLHQAQASGMAVVLLDVEGEYSHLHQPAGDPHMVTALAERGLAPAGLPRGRMALYHLVGREASNPEHPDRRMFSLQFARMSPYTIMEMLGCNDAQSERFLFAYDLAKQILRDLGIFPEKNLPEDKQEIQERILLHLDEFQRGYPRLTLSLFLDIVEQCHALVSKTTRPAFNKVLQSPEAAQAFKKYLNAKEMPGSVSSWGKLRSQLWRLNRLKVFDRHTSARFLNYPDLLRPGQVSVIDLSDTGMAELTNIAIADVLRGIQEEQEKAYKRFEKAKAAGEEAAVPPRVLLVIEEAHEFLSEDRIDRTPILYQQVARIAKRGRKRWLGLVFVTQLPQHLPRQVLGLVNSFVLHKITDPQVITTLRKTISGIEEGLWNRLPGLAPGQAIVSFPHLARPLLVSIDPARAKLRLMD